MKENIEILGKKIGMTQVFNKDNVLVPVTVIEAGPCPILQVKTGNSSDGYNAVQIGFTEQKASRLSKGALGHIKKAGVNPVATLREFRTENASEFKVGDNITLDSFQEGEKVDVIAKTIGRGFQGVVKRWNFGGGPASHGSMAHRRGGSYGQCQWPGEVQKGKKMPGRMGGRNRTTQGLEVVKIIPEKNLVLIKGSFPGSKGSLVTIRKTKKNKSNA